MGTKVNSDLRNSKQQLETLESFMSLVEKIVKNPNQIDLNVLGELDKKRMNISGSVDVNGDNMFSKTASIG